PQGTHGAQGVKDAQGECDFIDPEELRDRTVKITYKAEPGRQFSLSEVRLEGAPHFTITDFAVDLQTQPANALGFIPYLGYGHGYTSRDLLEQDRNAIAARLRDAGYRRATVDVRQGVSVDGENLIITFVVNEGPVTRLSGIEIKGNQIFSQDKLRGFMQSKVNTDFSSSRARTDAERIATLYANAGYIDTKAEPTLIELPKENGEERVRMVYNITEGSRTDINRIFVAGNTRTKSKAILSAIPLKEKKALRADDLTASESSLYGTDAFSQVSIRTEASSILDTTKKNDNVIITVTEAKPHILGYGFGFSTDTGPLGTFDIRHNNMFGMLRQGAIRVRASQRQQLAQFEYTDPRFRAFGRNQFAPLTFSLQYQRDTSVTRFFRSSIDRGNNGIVQRLDNAGNPIDTFGNRVNSPSINRLTFAVTTERTFGRKEKPGGTLLLRYSYEDVRLFNIDSLLIANVLQPDRKVRLSRFGATFVRDTRDSPIDAQRGEFLTLDYAIAATAFGGNISFGKFEGTYRRYFKPGAGDKGLGGTVFAGGVSLGLSSIFNPTGRDGNGVIDDVDRTLPISERFFSGGSTTIRGFDFEQAGPRIVVPSGTFFNNNGESVFLAPISVPIGGNALAVVNLEARIPVANGFSVVPFY
ncbi:MAG: BamA/OMP85 family outer membrane protein, partial [Pyrinomonadaceae bacterium]